MWSLAPRQMTNPATILLTVVVAYLAFGFWISVQYWQLERRQTAERREAMMAMFIDAICEHGVLMMDGTDGKHYAQAENVTFYLREAECRMAKRVTDDL